MRTMIILFSILLSASVFSQTKKKDSLFYVPASPMLAHQGDEVYSTAEKEAMTVWLKDNIDKRKAIALARKGCPEGKVGDACRERYREELHELEQAYKEKMEAIMRKYEIEKKYGLPEKMPGKDAYNQPVDYDKIALFIPKDYKESEGYKKDPETRAFMDDMKRDEDRLKQLYIALDKCPEGKAGKACREDVQKKIDEQKASIERKLKARLEEMKAKHPEYFKP